MRGRRGRPGLVGTMARTAVVAGTATAVSNNVSRRQMGRQQDAADQQAADQQAMVDQAAVQAAAQVQAQQAYAQPAAAAPQPDIIAQITQLADLKAAGILSEAEFAAAKAKLLG